MNSPPTSPFPQLNEGDTLSQLEFHRRYQAYPDLRHVQLIEGVVYRGSRVQYRHGVAHGVVVAWLVDYEIKHAGVAASGPCTLILDEWNEPEPDSVLFVELGGQTTLRDDYLVGPPELIAEVVDESTAHLDLGPRMEAYRRNGVREYLAWAIHEGRVLWLELVDGTYAELVPDDAGVIESRVFPGLRLNVKALASGDMDTARDAFRAG